MQKINTIIAVLIVVIPVGVALEVAVKWAIKKVHSRWTGADLFEGLKEE